MPFLVDSHCHLASLSYQGPAGTELADIVKRAYRTGVSHFLSVACTPAEFARQERLAAGFENIFLAAGIHPLNLEDCPGWREEELIGCLKNPRAVALGEMGLDYHYAPETRRAQLETFSRQLELAVELGKPVIIHAREAQKDTLELMRATRAREAGGVMHCFTDSVDMARQCLDLGFYISFTGIVTFRGSDNVREVLRYVPLDRVMVETDCPYLAPVPVRGVENEPAFVRYTLEFMAAFKGVSPARLAEITSANFAELFKVRLEQPAALEREVSDYKLKEAVLDRPFAGSRSSSMTANN